MIKRAFLATVPVLTGYMVLGFSFGIVLKANGYKVEERKLSVDEVKEAHKNGTLTESFGTGTAAVISPVGKLRYVDDVMIINNNEIGEVSQKLYDTLTGIQWGKREEDMGWTVEV